MSKKLPLVLAIIAGIGLIGGTAEFGKNRTLS